MSGKSIVILLFLCVLSSCTQPTYVANKLHVPFFDKEQQGQVEVSVTEAISPLGKWSFAGAAGYSLTDKIAIVGSAKLMEKSNGDTEYFQNSFYDLGIGIFNLPTAGDPFRIEGFARVGYGKMYTEDIEYTFDWFSPSPSEPAGFFSYNYWKYALQLNVGWQWDYFALGASLKPGYMNMQNLLIKIQNRDGDQTTTNNFVDSKGSFFIDYGAFMRFGPLKGVSLELQLETGRMDKNVGFSGSNKYSAISLGLSYKFDVTY